ncbi:hypothetical protein [Streptomyces sp. NBC_01285]|uniref:hypothetical protein n=1 Tax=Streptomyces sp. NBC_01285 TaxID=2903813 RepID=UPI002257562B|nr:hypothetical protein [Streptomyces sp. NBC_01285]MCX4774392.1 hypothetical protein [Streptomyces sp. NBC_01285]
MRRERSLASLSRSMSGPAHLAAGVSGAAAAAPTKSHRAAGSTPGPRGDHQQGLGTAMGRLVQMAVATATIAALRGQ